MQPLQERAPSKGTEVLAAHPYPPRHHSWLRALPFPPRSLQPAPATVWVLKFSSSTALKNNGSPAFPVTTPQLSPPEKPPLITGTADRLG